MKNKSETIITKRKNGKLRIQTIFDPQENRCLESAQAETDVNNIMAKYKRHEQNIILGTVTGTFQDFSELPDLQEALAIVDKANSDFMSLPSELRRKFGNDPTLLVEYLQDPKNIDESIELGLRIKREPNQTNAKNAPTEAPKENVEKK